MSTGSSTRDSIGTVARLRHVRTSPTKVRPVLKLILGQDVATARDTLTLCERAIAAELEKLLDSAIANAEHNDNVPADELFVARAYADEGPTAKRWRPRARGRGTRIRKRTSHITIIVARYDDEELARRRRAESASGTTRGRPTRRRRPRREPAVHDHDHDHDHDHEELAPTEVEETTEAALDDDAEMGDDVETSDEVEMSDDADVSDDADDVEPAEQDEE
jgi:large subunit ribosomal protein L22